MKMKMKMNMASFPTSSLVTTLFLLQIPYSAHAASYVVGDATGWTIPPTPTTYSSWASRHTFRTGDTLVFNFTTGIHDVAHVDKTSYDTCSSSTAANLSTVGPATLTLSSPGPNYFICTFPSHCSIGQKLSINVLSASTAPAPTSPPPAATAPTTRTPSSSPTPTPTPTAMPPSMAPSPSPSPSPMIMPGSPSMPPSPSTTSSRSAPGSSATPGASPPPSADQGPPGSPGDSAHVVRGASLSILLPTAIFFYYCLMI